jgi:hypothetical protein
VRIELTAPESLVLVRGAADASIPLFVDPCRRREPERLLLLNPCEHLADLGGLSGALADRSLRQQRRLPGEQPHLGV